MALTLHYPFTTNPSLTGHDALGLASSTPDLSITRATTATVVDAGGYIREVQTGEARFDGATFLENLAYESEDLSVWTTNTNVTVSDDADSINGISLSQITDDATSGQHIARYPNVYTSVGNVILSCYVKAGTQRYIAMGWRPVDLSIFDTTTGAWTDVDVAYDGSGVTDLGNGYYRIWLYGGSTAANDEQIVGVSSGSTAGDATYVGTGDTVLAGGFMVEHQMPGTTTPSTYLANDTTATVTSATGTSNGLLVEEARTNICLQSEDFSTTWVQQGNTLAIVGDEAQAPDGKTTADLIVDDSSTGSGTVGVGQSGLSVSDTTYTFSVFAKKNGLDWIDIRSFAGPAGSDGESYFDLTNGVVGTKDANHDSIDIEDYGNGWYRCSVVVTYATTDVNVQWIIYAADADGDRTVALDGTSSIYLWGAQLEVGAFQSSYIATTTASVTRNAEDVSGTLGGTEIPTDTFSNYISFSKSGGWNDNAIINYVDDGGATDRHLFFTDAGLDYNYLSTSSAGNNVGITPAETLVLDTTYKTAAGFAADDAVLYRGGSQTGTDTDCAVLGDSLTRFFVGKHGSSALYFNGLIKEIAYWDERLDNATLSGLSDASISIQGAGGGVLERKRRQHYRRQKLRAQGIRARETWAGTYRGRRT